MLELGHGSLKVSQVLGRKQIPPLVDTCISPTHLCPSCHNRRECWGWGAVCPHVAWWDTQNGLPPRSSFYTETPLSSSSSAAYSSPFTHQGVTPLHSFHNSHLFPKELIRNSLGGLCLLVHTFEHSQASMWWGYRHLLQSWGIVS